LGLSGSSQQAPSKGDVEKVLFSKDGVADGLSKGKIVVDMSSISPVATKEFAKRVNAPW
jgi:2-hydroxy-3-oxopropionate reductase